LSYCASSCACNEQAAQKNTAPVTSVTTVEVHRRREKMVLFAACTKLASVAHAWSALYTQPMPAASAAHVQCYWCCWYCYYRLHRANCYRPCIMGWPAIDHSLIHTCGNFLRALSLHLHTPPVPSCCCCCCCCWAPA
jgi:hypothetical protein